MSQREIWTKATDLEKAIIEAGVDPDVVEELFDEFEEELRSLLEEVEQELEEVESSEDSELGDGEDQ
ncbi:MAG: hypothetical protein H5T41_02225 [Methanomassiliicoccales archaeon]|nr:hypothetical protein [Methanomassiliicoccales archaeon]